MKRLSACLLFVWALMAFMPSCSQKQQAKSIAPRTRADTLINDAVYRNAPLPRLIELVDSLEQAGDISHIDACFTRGNSYLVYDQGFEGEAELNRALAATPQNAYDSLYHYQAVNALAYLYVFRQNYEGALRISLPALDGAQQMLKGPYRHKAYHLLEELYFSIGKSQMSLGMREDAAYSFEQVYEYGKQYAEVMGFAHTANALANSMGMIKESYEAIGDWQSAKKWMDRQDALWKDLDAREDVPDWVRDQIEAFRGLSHASYAAGTNQLAEATRAFDAYNKTQTARDGVFRFESAGVLLKMKRYEDAADLFMTLDSYLEESGTEASLDNMYLWKEKFLANYKAGRLETALTTATQAFDYLDSAIVKQKMNRAAELATVYETQKKDAEIAQQQISLSRQRWIGTLVALLLLTAFFLVYTWNRRRASNRLAEAHQKLQKAYGQLEETTAAKERIESELRIARDIQMSMVPNVFPQREGLDMYAEMTPAKEVGGDLYGYVRQEDKLYFCVGDVSGKGVPASLFMAQAVRLFRTLAAERMMPSGIAVRMNGELSENNDQGMFVTMFIGLLHLDTGRLDYCNCGHNAPVMDGAFLEMKYVNQPLGIWEEGSFEGETLPDIRGRQLLVYTDGLNEAENARHEQLGNARLLNLMAGAARMDSHQVIDLLKEAVEQHRAGAAPNDDLTLLCLKLS